MAKVVRQSLPLLISLALLAWLLWRNPPGDSIAAARQLNWLVLLPLTALLVLALYGWEAVCFRELFGLADRPLTYGQMLRVRGLSYLAGVVNYGAGQALAAWQVARLQRTSLLSTLSRTVLLAYHDLVVLFALASLGSALSAAKRAVELRPFCWIGLAGLIAVGVAVAALPHRWRHGFRASRWGAWLDAWSWPRSARLAGLRTVYFLILVAYAAIGMRLCDIRLDLSQTLGTIPLVLIPAAALPSASGLGSREVALQWLLEPERQDQDSAVLAMSLLWSSGLLIGRSMIGLVTLWWHGAGSRVQDGAGPPTGQACASQNRLPAPGHVARPADTSGHSSQARDDQ
jgi:hypothetical protein